MKQTKKGNLPVNARIDIDYTQTEPSIKFSYPKRNSVSQNIVGTHTYILAGIWLIFYIILGVYLNNTYLHPTHPYPSNCNITLNEDYKFSNLQSSVGNTSWNATYLDGIFIDCKDYNYNLTLNGYNDFTTEHGSIRMSIIFSLIEIISVAFLILINWLVTRFLVKQKWYISWLPKHEAKSCKNKLKYFKFLPNDVENNMVIIHNFANVRLEYKADGDFSKQLTNLKIREHQYFKFKKGKRVGKLQKKIYNWSAKFFFKDKPKDGYLEVVYY